VEIDGRIAVRGEKFDGGAEGRPVAPPFPPSNHTERQGQEVIARYAIDNLDFRAEFLVFAGRDARGRMAKMNIQRPQIGRRKRSHEIAELIEGAIAAGEFEVGTKLPSEKELAERYGVGRPSVREALFLLQQQGFVEVTSGARAQVTAPNAKFLSDQLAGLVKRTTARGQGQTYMEQARLLFESGVAWQAAQCATAEDVERLKQALDANTIAMGDTPEFIRTDVAFHYELTVITRNPVFSAIHDILVQWLIDQRTTTSHMPDADRLSVRDHTAIYEAVAARDPMRAFHEMTSHLKLVSQLYTESKRIHDEIMRNVARDVAARIDREKEAMWAGLRTSAETTAKPRRKRGTPA
jgi:DNA-binding FadR family transcriptional regulator